MPIAACAQQILLCRVEADASGTTFKLSTVQLFALHSKMSGELVAALAHRLTPSFTGVKPDHCKWKTCYSQVDHEIEI